MLAEKRKLYAFITPRNTWLPVNTLKKLKQINNILSEVNLTRLVLERLILLL